jgi:peptidoglycan/xylan/chitin deacetylase (PgdA/CDA1 family)
MNYPFARAILKFIFRARKNFAPGVMPFARSFDGVEITPFRGGARASATISADFEMAWAFRGRSEEERLQRGIMCRRNVPYLVAILEEMGIPITWATVGHLFLERCEHDPSGFAHEDMLRPPKNSRWDGDWYRHDPGTDWQTDPHWYAPDLIQLIRSHKVKHEIGSHSFSHIDFSKNTSTRELVEQELRACIKVMAPYGLHLRSLVYPFNNMGHHYLDLIGGLGLTAVRHRDKKVRLSYPERTSSGVYKLYESMNLRRASHYDYIEKARIFLDEAMHRHAAYHIWFHPSDPTGIFDHEFREIIQYMARLQRQGKLWVVTMNDLAAYCEAREQTTLEVLRNADELKITLQCNYDVKRYGKTVLTLRVTSDSMPSECMLRTEGRWEAVKWKSEELHVSSKKPRFLVDVPVTANELRVLFRPNYDWKHRRTTTLADPAFS